MIELLTFLWLFNTDQPALSTLTAQVPHAEFASLAGETNKFTVLFTVDLKPFTGENKILEIPNVLGVRLRMHDPQDRSRQNYPAFTRPDGSVPVLEATVVLHSREHPDWQNMTIGIPLAILKEPVGEHRVVLNFSGADWKMYVDGEMLDNDFPFGYPRWTERTAWNLDLAFVKEAAIYIPGIEPTPKRTKPRGPAPEVQYWTPAAHNNWVGDVVTCYRQGRYHVFYLYDRRHHQSKFGCGAHYFEHLSTRDFKTWTEHEAATPLEEQWECIGTGTPFVFNDTLCLSYGLHTTRVYPQEKTALPEQWDYLKQHGHSGEFKRPALRGVPAGSTYAVSEDGIAKFRKTGVLFHPCENPSVYIHPDGRLRMMANYRAKGIWESESVNGGWRCISPEFPPGGDCTFFLHWGQFDYIIGGFTGLWRKPAAAPDSAYEDVVRQGLDFYDGLAVPAITEIAKGRFLMAGWVGVRGWGGTLVIRELIQYPDGRIGSKWMPEITPRTGRARMVAAKIDTSAEFASGGDSFMLLFEVQPVGVGKGRAGITFLPETGEHAACELQIRPDDRRAQFGPGSLNRFAGPEKSLREGGSAGAIENLIGVDRPFLVRVIVKGNDKLGGCLVDAEIAGQRTLISYRPDLRVKRLVFRAEGLKLRDIRIVVGKNSI